MDLEHKLKIAGLILIGFLSHMFFFNSVSPVTIVVETNETAKIRWMEERQILHDKLYECGYTEKDDVK